MNNSNSTLFDIYSLCKDCYLLLLPGNSVAARQSQYDANECQSRGPASFGHLISSVLFSRRSLSLTHTHANTHSTQLRSCERTLYKPYYGERLAYEY